MLDGSRRAWRLAPVPGPQVHLAPPGRLAQLGERRLDKAEVAGSSPASPIVAFAGETRGHDSARSACRNSVATLTRSRAPRIASAAGILGCPRAPHHTRVVLGERRHAVPGLLGDVGQRLPSHSSRETKLPRQPVRPQVAGDAGGDRRGPVRRAGASSASRGAATRRRRQSGRSGLPDGRPHSSRHSRGPAQAARAGRCRAAASLACDHVQRAVVHVVPARAAILNRPQAAVGQQRHDRRVASPPPRQLVR